MMASGLFACSVTDPGDGGTGPPKNICNGGDTNIYCPLKSFLLMCNNAYDNDINAIYRPNLFHPCLSLYQFRIVGFWIFFGAAGSDPQPLRRIDAIGYCLRICLGARKLLCGRISVKSSSFNIFSRLLLQRFDSVGWLGICSLTS